MCSYFALPRVLTRTQRLLAHPWALLIPRTKIAQKLHKNCTEIAQKLHTNCTQIAQKLHKHCTEFVQKLHKNLHKNCTQIVHATQLRAPNMKHRICCSATRTKYEHKICMLLSYAHQICMLLSYAHQI